jgi:guanyl-specific ribonuclease Sa
MVAPKHKKKSKIFTLIIVVLLLICLCGSLASKSGNKQTTQTETTQQRASATVVNMPSSTAAQTAPQDNPSITPSSSMAKMLGKIWSGTEVYYGDPPGVVFTILGGNDSCPLSPSNRGIYVEYPDGTREWKDRNYIVTSGLFFVDQNDPAISKMEWFEYPCE